MVLIGFILVAAGIIAVIVGLLERRKASRVSGAPLASTGDVASKGPSVAGPKGAISAQGQVMCQQPVYAPMSGQPCLFYELKVTAEWKDGDTTKTKEVDHQKVAAQIAINDGSGPCWIDLREGGVFEPTERKSQSQSTGLLKGIVGGDLMFGNYRLSTGMLSLGTKYTVEENVLPVQQSLYVCGMIAEGGGAIVSPKGWSNLIVSNKTRDQLLASALKTAKFALIGGAAGIVIGAVLWGIGASMGPSKEEIAAAEASAKAAASAAASAQAAAAAAAASASAMPTEAPSASTTAAPTKPGTKPGTPTKSTAPTKATSPVKAPTPKK